MLSIIIDFPTYHFYNDTFGNTVNKGRLLRIQTALVIRGRHVLPKYSKYLITTNYEGAMYG